MRLNWAWSTELRSGAYIDCKGNPFGGLVSLAPFYLRPRRSWAYDAQMGYGENPHDCLLDALDFLDRQINPRHTGTPPFHWIERGAAP